MVWSITIKAELLFDILHWELLFPLRWKLRQQFTLSEENWDKAGWERMRTRDDVAALK